MMRVCAQNGRFRPRLNGTVTGRGTVDGGEQVPMHVNLRENIAMIYFLKNKIYQKMRKAIFKSPQSNGLNRMIPKRDFEMAPYREQSERAMPRLFRCGAESVAFRRSGNGETVSTDQAGRRAV
jgi:hypothetical protein